MPNFSVVVIVHVDGSYEQATEIITKLTASLDREADIVVASVQKEQPKLQRKTKKEITNGAQQTT